MIAVVSVSPRATAPDSGDALSQGAPQLTLIVKLMASDAIDAGGVTTGLSAVQTEPVR